MQKNSLKSKTEDARKELDTLLSVIGLKKPILAKLLDDITKAKETLESGFTERELKLKRDHLKLMETLTAEVNNVRNTITVLRQKEHDCLEVNKDLEDEQSILRRSIKELKREIARIGLDISSAKTIIINLQSRETNLQNNIDDLKSEKKRAEDELSSQIMQNGVKIFELQDTFNIEKNNLEFLLDEARVELDKVKDDIIINRQRIEADSEDYEQKEAELIQRENSLIVKTKALSKRDAVFEKEVRRWNYIKPIN